MIPVSKVYAFNRSDGKAVEIMMVYPNGYHQHVAELGIPSCCNVGALAEFTTAVVNAYKKLMKNC